MNLMHILFSIIDCKVYVTLYLRPSLYYRLLDFTLSF